MPGLAVYLLEPLILITYHSYNIINMGAVEPKRPVRVAGASGGFSDRVRAIGSLAKGGECDIIVGDWLSELTMTMHGAGKIQKQELNKGKQLSWEEQVQNAMFAENFMDCFEPAIDDIARRGIKLAVNAGASDTELLAKFVLEKVKEKGVDLNVAWVGTVAFNM